MSEALIHSGKVTLGHRLIFTTLPSCLNSEKFMHFCSDHSRCVSMSGSKQRKNQSHGFGISPEYFAGFSVGWCEEHKMKILKNVLEWDLFDLFLLFCFLAVVFLSLITLKEKLSLLLHPIILHHLYLRWTGDVILYVSCLLMSWDKNVWKITSWGQLNISLTNCRLVWPPIGVGVDQGALCHTNGMLDRCCAHVMRA